MTADECVNPSPDGGCNDHGGGGLGGGTGIGAGGGGGGGGGTSPGMCTLSCDNTRNIGVNECDREASVRQAACGAGALIFSETGPGAAAFLLACLVSSSNRTADCKNNAQNNYFGCATGCR